MVQDAQRKAQWNFWLILRDGSLGVHNTQYTIRLLQSSYTDLSKAVGGNSFQTDFPNAYVR